MLRAFGEVTSDLSGTVAKNGATTGNRSKNSWMPGASRLLATCAQSRLKGIQNTARSRFEKGEDVMADDDQDQPPISRLGLTKDNLLRLHRGSIAGQHFDDHRNDGYQSSYIHSLG